MNRTQVDDEIIAIGDSLLRFLEREVAPLEDANRELLATDRTIYDERGYFVEEVAALRRTVRMRSAEQGFYTMFGPEEIGGGGLGPVAAVYLNALLAEASGPGRVLVHPVVVPSPFTNGLSPVLTALGEDQRARFLPGLASGEKTLCFALSEPDAGSDVFGMKSRAVRDGDDWIITGTKQWITNGPYADYVMVFAVTDPELASQRKGGITGFFVETASAGFSVASTIPVMGHLGAEIGILSFDGVRVPDVQRLGEAGQGLKVAMKGVNTGRLGLSATCIGLARWALNQALDYAKVRKTFGKPIGEHQAVQILLAESALDIYSAETMLMDCASKLEKGVRSIAETSMVKLHCTEAANRVFDRCIQVHGGMGLTNELRLEEGYRFTRSMRIPDGTSEIQRRTIARELLASGVNF
ncbi:acyl-CoA dehydrogenase family protein [Hoeflea sp. EC-HK425]|uniref:acyl-CoA dehydrogenase family protein n=1 Tax=Hoeflea sp. EC-HK425 TaxID=2038388 RepID=UPI00125A19C5|nr:acyl-CoA dehydrogenase family protein [Hoeflea sp. EC-HK425]VVT01081.1 Acyl-CoA dehydrogenase [Hoeflea sp. EC-HK425]